MTNPFPSTEMVARTRGILPWARLSTNESEFGLAEEVVAVIGAVASEANRYPDCDHFELRSALAAAFGLDRDNILISSGIDGLLHAACRAYGRARAVVATEGTYPTFRYFADAVGAVAHLVPYRSFQIDAAAILETAAAQRASLVYIAEPDNPTGSAMGRAALADFIEALPPGCLLLLDGAYSEFQAPAERPAIADFLGRNVIWLRTFSKGYGLAGLRIGYAVGRPELLAPIFAISEHYVVSRLAQAAARAALDAPRFLERVVEEVAAGRADYSSALAALGISVLPSHTNFVAALDDGSVSLKEVSERLASEGIFTRYLQIGATGLFRLTIGPAQQRNRVLGRLNAAVHALRR